MDMGEDVTGSSLLPAAELRLGLCGVMESNPAPNEEAGDEKGPEAFKPSIRDPPPLLPLSSALEGVTVRDISLLSSPAQPNLSTATAAEEDEEEGEASPEVMAKRPKLSV